MTAEDKKFKLLVTFKAQAYRDREALVTALTNLGYAVKINEKKRDAWSDATDYFVEVYK